MTDVYGVLIALHILLTVSWLGVDAGVFIGSHMIRNRAYAPDARFLLSRLMGYLDLGPRLSVPLLFAVGLSLAYLGNWASMPAGVVVGFWIVAVAWCLAILYAFMLQHRLEAAGLRKVSPAEHAWLRAYRRIDLWARWVWVAAIVGALLGGVFGVAVFKTTWLTWKVALFGVVILVGNGLRLIPGTSSMAIMAEIHRLGSTTERENALYRRLSLTHPIVLTMYACVIASVFLGVLKPG
ncbi:MAG: hypothetical protein JO352_06710 [Chloroflexi bacterium]|nr:hypothetical protein [Chloroflexota bacterium]